MSDPYLQSLEVCLLLLPFFWPPLGSSSSSSPLCFPICWGCSDDGDGDILVFASDAVALLSFGIRFDYDMNGC
jgi:hypothetical protein